MEHANVNNIHIESETKIMQREHQSYYLAVSELGKDRVEPWLLRLH